MLRSLLVTLALALLPLTSFAQGNAPADKSGDATATQPKPEGPVWVVDAKDTVPPPEGPVWVVRRGEKSKPA